MINCLFVTALEWGTTVIVHWLINNSILVIIVPYCWMTYNFIFNHAIMLFKKFILNVVFFLDLPSIKIVVAIVIVSREITVLHLGICFAWCSKFLHCLLCLNRSKAAVLCFQAMMNIQIYEIIGFLKLITLLYGHL